MVKDHLDQDETAIFNGKPVHSAEEYLEEIVLISFGGLEKLHSVATLQWAYYKSYLA